MDSMKDEYGADKAKKVFYASRNAGKIIGVDPESTIQKKKKRKFAALRDYMNNPMQSLKELDSAVGE